jgi:hypothetical protein
MLELRLRGVGQVYSASIPFGAIDNFQNIAKVCVANRDARDGTGTAPALAPQQRKQERSPSMTVGRKIWLGLMGLFTAAMVTNTPATAQQTAQKPNILFIMGDDIGWMQPGIYHQGLMVGETPNIDRIGQEGAKFMDYYAMQSCTSGRNAFFTGMYPLRTGMIPPQLPGSPSWLRPGTPALAKFLIDLGYNTGEFGKNHLGDNAEALPTAHGFQEYWGYLYHLDAMQMVSFPDVFKDPKTQAIVPPCQNTPVPGLPDVPGAVDPKTTACVTSVGDRCGRCEGPRELHPWFLHGAVSVPRFAGLKASEGLFGEAAARGALSVLANVRYWP